MNRRLLPLSAFGGLLALLGCRGDGAKPAATAPPVVTVGYPVERMITDYEKFPGRTAAVESVDVRARATGYLEEVLFKEGDEVHKGDELYKLDDRTYKADLAKAEANVRSAQARYEQAAADLARARKLIVGAAMSRAEYDKMVADQGSARAEVAAQQAAADRLKVDLEFTTVRAEISGKISRTQVTAGNLVTANSTLLTNIVSVDPMYVYFDVDDRTAQRVRKLIREGKVEAAKGGNYKITFALEVDPGDSHTATIDFVDNRVDPSTGTLRVRAVFPNPVLQRGQRLFVPGMYTRVRVPIGPRHPALLVPERALGTDQGQKFVYVVDAEDKVVYRRVTVGSLDGGLRVITGGLSKGERVITNGLQRVRPGVPVSPRVEKAQAKGK